MEGGSNATGQPLRFQDLVAILAVDPVKLFRTRGTRERIPVESSGKA
jgi:hypothetical protein